MNLIDTIFSKKIDIDQIEQRDIYSKYGRILILCKHNGKRKDNCDNLSDYMVKVMPINLIKNLFIRNKIKVVNYEYLKENFNIDRKYFNSVDQEELILNLSTISENKISSFLLQFNSLNSFQDYIIATVINDYIILKKYNELILKNRINMLQTMSERMYWALSYNCNLNITLQFMKRDFNLQIIKKLDDKNLKIIIEKINNTVTDENNYLNYLYRKDVYVDAASSINKKGYKLYRITDNALDDIMTIETFNNFIKENINMTDEEFYYLVMNLLSSKELCHYIINNEYMLRSLLINNFYGKYYYIFKYYLSYAWLTFYLEESIKKRNVKVNDRFIFNIETACLLPDTPFQSDTKNNIELHTSAYLPLLISEKILNISENILSVIPKRYGNNLNYGVCNMKAFEYRQQLFISGDEKINLLNNLNWKNIVISGSIIACCLPKFNPLMLKLMKQDDIINNTIHFLKYINEYYKDADIDMICNLDGVEFIDKAYEVTETIKNNIELNYEVSNNIPILIKPVISALIIINEDFIKNNLVNENLTLSEILLDTNANRIKELIYPFYLKHKYNKNKEFFDDINNKKYIKDLKYSVLFDLVSIKDLNICYNNNAKNNNIKNLFILKDNVKYKLSSKFLPHSIELFKINNEDFFSIVSSFHLPIVRAYYDGYTVKMTPSCISACMTMINLDYKYFSGAKDPIEIINKYLIRGFSTILNDKEKIKFIEYNKVIEKWKNVFKIGKSVKKLFGFKTIYNNIFEYSKNVYNIDKPINYLGITPKIPDIDQSLIYTLEKLYNFSETKYMLDMNEFKCINEYGYINPMKHYLIDYFYNII
jgi:hypothetical protein